MSEQVVINHHPLCDVYPDHGWAVVDGRMKDGPWAYMCPTCWDLYGVGKFGTGNGQRLLFGSLPPEHSAALARDGDAAGVYHLTEQEARDWRMYAHLPDPPAAGMVVTPPIAALSSGSEVFVGWHRVEVED